MHKLICSIWFYVCWFITQSVVFNWMHVWVFNQWYGQVQGCQGVSWIYSLMRENSIPILLIHSLFFPSRTNIDFPFRILVVFTFSWFYHLFSFSQPARFSQRRLNSKQWHKLKWWTSNNVRSLFVEMFKIKTSTEISKGLNRCDSEWCNTSVAIVKWNNSWYHSIWSFACTNKWFVLAASL